MVSNVSGDQHPADRRRWARLALCPLPRSCRRRRIGIVDDDVVDASNLQRQVLHSTAGLGERKARSARKALAALNPDVEVVTYEERLTSQNADRILTGGWDLIVDGADNFPTRYLLNDASVWHDIPVVHGSIFRFEGRVTVSSHTRARATAASSHSRRRSTKPSCAEGRGAQRPAA